MKATTIKKTRTVSISKSKAYELMTNNKGRFFTVEFTKKKGQERVMNCQALKEQTSNLGYLKVKEASLMRKGENAVRNVNMQTISGLKIAGRKYKVK